MDDHHFQIQKEKKVTSELTDREKVMLSNTDVEEYIVSKNKERNSQAERESWECWTLMPDDKDFISQFKNVYELEHMYAVGSFSDIYKEKNCFRPRWDFSSLTLSEIESEIEKLYDPEDQEHKELSTDDSSGQEPRHNPSHSLGTFADVCPQLEEISRKLAG